jgi:uncharacterized protein with NRDE domain
MCLILFSYDLHPEYRLILAANRDEYYERPTRPLGYWEDAPGVLAGRDMKNSGTWMGMARTGRFAALTNYRDPASLIDHAPSRGLLVSSFLTDTQDPKAFLEAIKTKGHQYNGFNLLVGDFSGMYCFSNKIEWIKKLSPGLYGLSNHLLDTPWPKVVKGKAAFSAAVGKTRRIDLEDLFAVLADNTPAPDDQLPDTGVGHDFERILSPIFIKSPVYGTRSSSVVLVKRSGKVIFSERTFQFDGASAIPEQTLKYEFKISSGLFE